MDVEASSAVEHAFIPAPLSPTPSDALTPELAARLGRIDAALERGGALRRQSLDLAALAKAPRDEAAKRLERLLDPSLTLVRERSTVGRAPSRLSDAASRLSASRIIPRKREQLRAKSAGARIGRTLLREGEVTLFTQLASANPGLIEPVFHHDTSLRDAKYVGPVLAAVSREAVEDAHALDRVQMSLVAAGDLVRRYFKTRVGKDSKALQPAVAELLAQFPVDENNEVKAVRVGLVLAGAINHSRKMNSQYHRRADWSRDLSDLIHVITGQFVWPVAVAVVGVQIVYATTARPPDFETALSELLGRLRWAMTNQQLPPEVFQRLQATLNLNGIL